MCIMSEIRGSGQTPMLRYLSQLPPGGLEKYEKPQLRSTIHIYIT